MAYDLSLPEPANIVDLRFPDITKLGQKDRNYDEVRYEGRRNPVPEAELESLQLRSTFYEDLGVQSLDEHFLMKKDSWGREYHRPDTLEGIGGAHVAHAVRTFTTDTDVIKYRLDIQDDLDNSPGLIPAMQKFYTETVGAQALHEGAYAKDNHGRRIRDRWGRYVFKDWAALPKSFAKLDQAIDDFMEVLDTTSSQGMRDVYNFLQSVKDHHVYQAWTRHGGQVEEGSRYFFAFQYTPVDGANLTVQLGPVVPESLLDQLLDTPMGADGEIETGFDDVVMKRVTGLVRSEFGHLMQEMTGLDFGEVGSFCSVLVDGMKQQFSFYAALGHMYQQWEDLGIPVSRPTFGEGDGIDIQQSVHPVIAKLAHEETGNFTLNDYRATSEQNGLLVTGPNDGGKTASGKGFGLAIALAQAGIRVPAQHFAMEKPVGEIYTHFILKEEVNDARGRHKNELLRARRLCEAITPDDFLLYDEPCGGTDVKSGLIDSKNLLEYARRVGTPFIFATHIHELAGLVEAGEFPGVRNVQAEIVGEGDDLVLTHRIIPGRARESYGSRVSREIGVDATSLAELLEYRIGRGELDRAELKP